MPQWDGLARSQQTSLLRLNRDISNRELARILREAAEEAADTAARISKMQGVGARTRAAQLRIAEAGARDISRQLWNVADKQIRAGIFESTNMALHHALELDLMLGMPDDIAAAFRAGIEVNAGRSAEAIIARNQHGYTLSERVYRNEALSSRRIYDAIDRGLAQQLSAREMANSVRHMISPTTPGGVSYSAMRLSRTEINNSYHHVSRERYAKKPWVNQVAWHLSGSHGRPDRCDELQELSPYDPKYAPDRPHPQCLCYIVPVTPSPEEFQDNLLSGGYDDYLASEGLDPVGASRRLRVVGGPPVESRD